MGAEAAIAVGRTKLRLTVDDFDVLDRAGAFDGLGRVELIEGEIFVVSPLYKPHAAAHLELAAEFRDAVRRSGLPIQAFAPVSTRLDRYNAPEPDVIIAAITADPYVSRESALLAVEISSTSLLFDLGKKATLYAEGGVPEYWIVDVAGARVICLTEPVDGAYRQRREYLFGERITASTLRDLWIDTTGLRGG